MTHIIKSLNDFCRYRQQPELINKKIGLVPTMGALHAGHCSLMQHCREENEITILYIFVNPYQFNNPEDLKKYPRNDESDIAIAKKEKVDVLFMPTANEIYADEFRFQIKENKLSQLLEGHYRPGHFEGVMTVIMKMLHIVQPNNIYFGEKDYQQYLLIKDMVNAFCMNTTVVCCPTIREADGLPLSSRNQLLTEKQRILAAAFPKILFNASLSIEEIKNQLSAAGLKVEYVADYQGRRYAAVYIGNIRLIDNIKL